MTSKWRNQSSAMRRTHKERAQPKSRARFGLLEKKKDYKLRSSDYKKKQKKLQALKERAYFRNPDEFYFKMINSKTENGLHKVTRENRPHTQQELKILKSQDLSYLNFKLGIEQKKISKIKESLHCLDGNTTHNKHTIFVDTKEEVDEFEPSEFFDTAPELVSNKSNRPTRSQLKDTDLTQGIRPKEITAAKKQMKASYRELAQRMNRSEKLAGMADSLTHQRKLQEKGSRKVVGKTLTGRRMYRWKPTRKF